MAFEADYLSLYELSKSIRSLGVFLSALPNSEKVEVIITAKTGGQITQCGILVDTKTDEDYIRQIREIVNKSYESKVRELKSIVRGL